MMLTNAKATVRLKFQNIKQISTILEALAPETNSPLPHRAKAKLEKDGLFLILSVEAEDTVALRATLNAYLHWINSMNNVIVALERHSAR
jgi:tRNA threonylcarbamoyladenosine modification (KEOPS) complex  Pcc1 subunit